MLHDTVHTTERQLGKKNKVREDRHADITYTLWSIKAAHLFVSIIGFFFF